MRHFRAALDDLEIAVMVMVATIKECDR